MFWRILKTRSVLLMWLIFFIQFQAARLFSRRLPWPHWAMTRVRKSSPRSTLDTSASLHQHQEHATLVTVAYWVFPETLIWIHLTSFESSLICSFVSENVFGIGTFYFCRYSKSTTFTWCFISSMTLFYRQMISSCVSICVNRVTVVAHLSAKTNWSERPRSATCFAAQPFHHQSTLASAPFTTGSWPSKQYFVGHASRLSPAPIWLNATDLCCS